MPQHEIKACPRCQQSFECKVGNVAACQCNGITFNEAEKYYMIAQYADCLCRNCLLQIKHEIRLKEFNAVAGKLLS